MSTFTLATALALAASIGVGAAHPAPAHTSASQTPDTASSSSGLNELDAMTFACPKAALNAAARRAAAVPSQGSYQFSYFEIVSDSHHAMYEVRFKSNYEGEPELKYCVEIYCQEGWDPKTAKTDVTLMSSAPPRAAVAAHGSACSQMHAPASRRRTK